MDRKPAGKNSFRQQEKQVSPNPCLLSCFLAVFFSSYMDLNVASAAKLAPAFLALAMVFHNFLLEKNKNERLDWNDLVLAVAGLFVLRSHS